MKYTYLNLFFSFSNERSQTFLHKNHTKKKISPLINSCSYLVFIITSLVKYLFDHQLVKYTHSDCESCAINIITYTKTYVVFTGRLLLRILWKPLESYCHTILRYIIMLYTCGFAWLVQTYRWPTFYVVLLKCFKRFKMVR